MSSQLVGISVPRLVSLIQAPFHGHPETDERPASKLEGSGLNLKEDLFEAEQLCPT